MASAAIWGVVVGGFLVYVVVKSIYRLYFHPLHKIPGPKLAAITTLYEFYFNVIKQGTFIWEVERLHKVYGPIIRISPREVHIKDSDYYDEIYASSARRREKDLIHVTRLDLNKSSFGSISPEVHRQRRAPVEKFFSKAAITNNEHIIKRYLDKFIQYLHRACESNSVVSLDAGFSALTSDIIHQYGFGFDSGNLEKEDFNQGIRDGISALLRSVHIAFFFPFIQTIMNALPLEAVKVISPFAFALKDQKNKIRNVAIDALAGKRLDSPSIIRTLVAPNGPAHLRDVECLTDEGFAMVIGGTETTTRSLSIGFFHILNNDNIRRKLREELQSVMPTPQSEPTWNELEKLPYLTNVVLEALRLSTGIANRSPRVAPTEALVYKDHVIPAGYPISQMNYFVLMDPNIFPDPHTFDPDRWARAAARGERLDKYLVNFSKGSRVCVGLNLAYAELYITIAVLIRRFELELYKTTIKNLEFARDFGTPCPDEGNPSIQVFAFNFNALASCFRLPSLVHGFHHIATFLQFVNASPITTSRISSTSCNQNIKMPSSVQAKAALSLIETDKSKILGLSVGTHKNVQPGDYIPRADAQSPPELSFSGLDSSKTYLAVNLDIDAPFPSWGVLGPILHWIQPGVKASESGSLTTTGPFVANYIGPAPPPGSSPHRYIFFLYEEPAGFDAKQHAPPNGQNLSNWNRMRYDFDAWAKKVDLGPIVAFNYFTSN
ncbi:hypothetical protein N7462_003477 [Penicillium macrosclerotiorum]|uniref:uncharacterized protein n=1 Tax=Penicillium macrosclerotiorum TaxID=303699 RepID=UPI002547F08B|nr:uncharacterized protein N7462_003477 [Penicillium macrosclerotiorum]KAJ5689085.1 hypothetical protein N7462_003477 [Penicillium macrosclerotiorum]